jgi:hypothetical protein
MHAAHAINGPTYGSASGRPSGSNFYIQLRRATSVYCLNTWAAASQVPFV